MNEKIRVPLDLNERVIDHVASGSNDADIGQLKAATKFAREEAAADRVTRGQGRPDIDAGERRPAHAYLALQSAQRVAAKLDAARTCDDSRRCMSDQRARPRHATGFAQPWDRNQLR